MSTPPRGSRADWLSAGTEALIADGVGAVKVLSLARAMGASRSSFYWFFEDRADLLSALLDHWGDTNTARFLSQASLSTPDIDSAICEMFRLFLVPELFDPGLDSAIRDWARTDADVRARLDAADAARIEAVSEMFARHGYAPADADIRARVLYWMQIGYYALDLAEPLETRLEKTALYLPVLTGRPADLDVVARFKASIANG